MSSDQNASPLPEQVHDDVQAVNPYPVRSSFSRATVIGYRLATTITYLIFLLNTIYYTFRAPIDGGLKRRTIWGQNRKHHSPFALNSVITSIYWIVLFIIQVPYLVNVWTATEDALNLALNLAPAFTANNLLLFGFIHLWCRSYFYWAELLLIINFVNLTFAYFRFPKSPIITHVGVLSAPLAFTFVALFWDGAAAVNAHNLPARVVANVFVWTWPVYGSFYLVAFKDFSMGFALSVLSASLGVAQFLTVIVALQWIFAFTIMALMFVMACGVASGIDPFKKGSGSEEREREPLLGDQAA